MGAKKIILQRYKSDENQTTGTLSIVDSEGWLVFTCPCIERGDLNNLKRKSNVPPGTYKIVFEYSPAFDAMLWELKGVPNRSECKIHASNYWYQLNGCIAPGMYLKNINEDKYIDVGASKRALGAFNLVLKGIAETTITIKNP